MDTLVNDLNQQILKETISYCFRLCDFFRAKCRVEPEDELPTELENIGLAYSSLVNNVTLAEVLGCDTDIPVAQDCIAPEKIQRTDQKVPQTLNESVYKVPQAPG